MPSEKKRTRLRAEKWRDCRKLLNQLPPQGFMDWMKEIGLSYEGGWIPDVDTALNDLENEPDEDWDDYIENWDKYIEKARALVEHYKTLPKRPRLSFLSDALAEKGQEQELEPGEITGQSWEAPWNSALRQPPHRFCRGPGSTYRSAPFVRALFGRGRSLAGHGAAQAGICPGSMGRRGRWSVWAAHESGRPAAERGERENER